MILDLPRKKRRKCLLGALIIAFCLWYVRPVDIQFLLHQTEPVYIEGSVMPQSDFPHLSNLNLHLTVEENEAESVMKQLEALRFHRSLLEPLLRLLPVEAISSGAKTVEPEKDYVFYLSFFDGDWKQIQTLEFQIDTWSYDLYGKLPLYLYHGQEAGRELGTTLLKIAE